LDLNECGRTTETVGSVADRGCMAPPIGRYETLNKPWPPTGTGLLLEAKVHSTVNPAPLSYPLSQKPSAGDCRHAIAVFMLPELSVDCKMFL